MLLVALLTCFVVCLPGMYNCLLIFLLYTLNAFVSTGLIFLLAVFGDSFTLPYKKQWAEVDKCDMSLTSFCLHNTT